jgi:hypothetical protein
MAVAEIVDVTHVRECLLAFLQRHLHLLPESLVGERHPLGRDKFAVEPRRALVADLRAEASGRQDADADVGAIAGEVLGMAVLREICGDAPMIHLYPLDMACPAQRLHLRTCGRTNASGSPPLRAIADDRGGTGCREIIGRCLGVRHGALHTRSRR